MKTTDYDLMFLVAQRDFDQIDRDACKAKLDAARKNVDRTTHAPVEETARAKRMVECLERALEKYERRLELSSAKVSELD